MEWQPIATCPEYEDIDVENAPAYIVRAIHDYSGPPIHVVGRFILDGFYMEDGSELSYNYTATHWMPLPPPPKSKQHQE